VSFSQQPLENGKQLPPALRDNLQSHLEFGEKLLACLDVDLDGHMRYAQQYVVLTDRRVLWLDSDGLSGVWPLDPTRGLRLREHGTTGILELVGPEGLIHAWRFTAAKSVMARRFIDRWEESQRLSPEQEDTAPINGIGAVCPICGEPLASDRFSCPCTANSSARPTWALFRLRRFARHRAGMLVLGIALTMASTAAGLIPPYITIPLFNRVLVPHQNGLPVDFRLVYWYLAGMAGAAVLAWLLSWGRTFVLAWVSERISADLRSATYTHLHRLSLEFFGGKRTGDLISRVSSDTDRICYILSVNLSDFLSDMLMIAMTALVMVTIDPWLALVTLLPLPPIAWLVNRVRSRLRRGFHRASAAWAEMTSVLADTIPGIRVVKAFAQEQREIERFNTANDRVLAANDRVNTVWSFFGPMVVLLTEAGVLVIWVFGVWRVFQRDINVGELTAFIAYITRFYARLDSMSRVVSAVQRAAASAARVFEILDRVPSVAEPAQPVPTGRMCGAIEFAGVGFRYGNRTILDKLDLKIRAGEMIGLVGPSGAGKTTLVNLVCRFYDVTEGAILVDGNDIRAFKISDYRRHIGIVLQEPFLFYGTIAENIAYGRPQASRQDIIAAARAARAHEFILRLPDGYDSLVGERGQTLSGGERQRISIARALLIDPRILIFDEATSSVDTETEHEIQLALENLVRGRTTIAIAHRLSTLRRADRLVVIEHGRITEIGHHDQLIETAGTYARLYRAQLETDAQHIAVAEGA
jgi:ATP-binding cassette subfamily B protein